MRNVLLDTSVLITDERGQWDAASFNEAYVGEGKTGISAISASEFLEGVFRAPPGKRRESRRAFFDFILGTYPVFPFDLEIASTHAELKAELGRAGVAVGAHDLIIGATCLHLGWEVATLNIEEFTRIPGLVLAPARDYLLARE
jgi:predicted nucleic acid-binding protein